jgi:hypothetical protein
MNKQMTQPMGISADRINYLIGRGIEETIARLDMEMIKHKISQPDELAWTPEQISSAELEYKRYLQLCKNNGRGMVPNKIMDEFWHYHILDTRAYCTDCDSIFGGMLHHFPYFGIRGEEDARNLQNAFEKTKELYQVEFGEPMARDEHSSCWHDCESRCWHACSDE